MNDVGGDLSETVTHLTLQVMALQRLVQAFAALAPELLAIVRRLPDPAPQGVEFLGRRWLGSAEAGTAFAQLYRDAWRDLVSGIDQLYKENSP